MSSTAIPLDTLVRLLGTLLDAYNRLPTGSVPQQQAQQLLERVTALLEAELPSTNTAE